MFIPPAERYRLISKLDLFVFEEVCRTLARWKAEGRELLPISVNLSRQNMDTPNFLDDYRRLCKKYDVNPNLIEFELTETILFEDPQGIKCFIDEMHASGFQCSLDDFGTGFSALGLLNDLDVDAIKLDQSFFRGKMTPGGDGILWRVSCVWRHSCIFELWRKALMNCARWSICGRRPVI